MDRWGDQGGWSAASDGLDDPATVNGRLLRGRQGTLAAWERHTMQARRPAGLLHQAPRGEGALTLPTGLVRNAQGQGLNIPTQAAPARWALGFETFLPCRCASKGVDICNRPALRRPRRDRLGEVLWTAPRVAAGLALLQPPASAGAFPYGRTRTGRREARQRRPSLTRLPQDQGRIGIPNVSPASRSWETSRQIQALLTETHAEYARNTPRGMPRPGKALLHGLGDCGACGHTRVVPDKGGTRALGHDLRQPYRPPGGQAMAAAPVAPRVVDAFFQALSPGALDGDAQALAQRQQQAERIPQAPTQPLERRRSEAAYCARPCRHVDPAHRHGAAAVEHAGA